MKLNWRSTALFIFFVALPMIAVAVLVANLQGLPFAAKVIAAIRGVAEEWWAVPLFVAMYIVFALLLLPVGLLSAAAALAWGWKLGGSIELISLTIAALVPFHLARSGLAPRVSRFFGRHHAEAPHFDNEPEFFPLLLIRLVPIIPYVAVNYLAGVARFRKRDYVLATFLGSIPSIYLFSWFVDTVGAGATGGATHLRVILACAVIAVVAVIMRVAAGWVRRRLSSKARTAPPPEPADPRYAAQVPPPE